LWNYHGENVAALAPSRNIGVACVLGGSTPRIKSG
jgi:hypothetical protein